MMLFTPQQNTVELKPLFSRGDLIRITVPLSSGWKGTALVVEDVYDENDIVHFIPWEKHKELMKYFKEDGTYSGPKNICMAHEVIPDPSITVINYV